MWPIALSVALAASFTVHSALIVARTAARPRERVCIETQDATDGRLSTASAPLPAEVLSTPRALFDAMTFDAWRVVGDRARFELRPPTAGDVGPTLVGRGPIARNGFLASPRQLSDFRLTVDVRLGSTESPRGEKMNSGIQIRSREKDGTIAGLQIEVDPTPRRWSGGVYDERGRGWLASLADNAAAQDAFRSGDWNTYEIECLGPRVRTKVNGVACAEWYDGIVDGLLAFQVHGGPLCEVAFRAPVLEELGAHAWVSLSETPAAASGEHVAWRAELRRESSGVRFACVGAGTLELQAGDGSTLASIALDPMTVVSDGRGGTRETTAEERGQKRHVEAVWFETTRDGVDGAVLVDGARVAHLSLAANPSQVRMVGSAMRVERVEQLLPKP